MECIVLLIDILRDWFIVFVMLQITLVVAILYRIKVSLYQLTERDYTDLPTCEMIMGSFLSVIFLVPRYYVLHPRFIM